MSSTSVPNESCASGKTTSAEQIGDTRLLLGLIFAPALLPIYVAIIPCFDFYAPGGLDLELRVAFAAITAYTGTAIFGLPCVFFMRGRGWLNYWTIMIPTLILAGGIVILEQTFLYGPPGVFTGVMSAAPGVLLVGIGFYLLAVWRYEADAKWTILLSIAFVWLLHAACVAIQKHNFLTSNPMSDTGPAFGLMIVIRGGRILSLAVTVGLACVWLVPYLLNGRPIKVTNLQQQAIHREPED